VNREVAFAGDGGRLTIGVVSYEFNEDASGSEANWLKGGVRIELSATGAFRCSVPVLYMADEMGYFRDDLGRILERRKGEATLETEEDRVSITVTLGSGEAALSGYVQVDGFARLDFIDIRTDEESLRRAHAQLVELAREFPVRTRAG
jgi:hypothetical protein